MKSTYIGIIALALITQPIAGIAVNSLRNGSFEGGMRYWYTPEAKYKQVSRGGSEGNTYLHIEDGFIWSGSFQLAPGAQVTLSADVRTTAAEGHVHFYLVPNSRASGVEPFKVFYGKSGVGRTVTEKDWTRANWQIDIPGGDFQWDNPHWWDRKGWMLFVSGKALDIDAICISLDGKKEYVGEDKIEVAVNAAVPGDPMKHWNLLEPGKAVEFETRLHNPAKTASTVLWIHSITDYTGQKTLAGVPGGSAILSPGETRVEKWSTILPGKGLMLARTIVIDSGGKNVGKSDCPVTVLAFPKQVMKKPDQAERFGYSLNDVGAPPWTHVYDILSKVGFAWSRWHPHTGWSSIQPDGPDQWNWPDSVLNDLEARGCSYNITMNGIPGWAKGTNPVLPKDMEWSADDPRWNDMSITTSWDRFVDEAVRRWGNGKRSVVWEILNEPEWEPWDPAVYTRFIERSAKRIRAIDPKAQIMVNGCYGVDDLHKGFLANGGASSVDIFSFHNYAHGGWFTTGDSVRGMAAAFRAGGKEVQIWFNEGWTHWPSSEDTRAYSVFAERSPVQVAHETLCATAEGISEGLHQVIMFNTARNGPTRSWWDYNGDGNIIWDEGGRATVAVGLFNVMADQLGLSKPVGRVKPRQSHFHVFDDLRNKRGVAVVWTDAVDTEFLLPHPGMMIMDVMGNAEQLHQKNGSSLLHFEDAHRPWYLFKPGLSGKELLALLKPFDSQGTEQGSGQYAIPNDWASKGAESNPYLHNGVPVWRAGRVWPPNLDSAASYLVLPQWNEVDGKWSDPNNSNGGHPSVKITDGFIFSSVTSWAGDPMDNKPAYLSFAAPADGIYELSAVAHSYRWTGDGQTWIHPVVLNRSGKTATLQTRINLNDRADTPVKVKVQLSKGQELVLVYGIDSLFTGSECRLSNLLIKRAEGNIDPNRPVIK